MVYHLERQREVELLHMRVHEHALSPPSYIRGGIPKAVLRQLGYTLLCTGAGLRFEHHYLLGKQLERLLWRRHEPALDSGPH